MDACTIGFGFDPATCIVSVWEWALSFIPFGSHGAVAIIALIIGAVFKEKALAALGIVVGFMIGKRVVASEDQYPHPDQPAPKKKRKTLF